MTRKLIGCTVLFISGIVIFRCRSPYTYQAPAAMSSERSEVTMVLFNVAADTIGKSQITLVSNITVAGQIKGRASDIFPDQNSIISNTYFKVGLMDDARHLLAETSIEHPLYRPVEFITDNGELARKMTSLKESSAGLRFRKPSTARYLMIAEIYDGRETKQTLFDIREKSN